MNYKTCDNLYLVYSDEDELKAVFTKKEKAQLFKRFYDEIKMYPCTIKEYRTKQKLYPIETEVF